jgi:hypothetical protein
MEPSNEKDILEALASFWIPFLILFGSNSPTF